MLRSVFNSLSLPDGPETPTPSVEPPFHPNAIWVNLRDYGFTKAGEHHGDASALRNLFNQIRQGFILDENANGDKQRRERERIEADIAAQERSLGELKTDVRRINETEIPKIEGSIALVDDDINQAKLNALKQAKDPAHLNRFNLRLYWVIFAPATLFLILFYASAFHSAFYRNVIGEVQASNVDVASVLNAIFNWKALTELNLHWLAPVVFFVFGMILHIVYDGSGRGRWAKLAGVLLFILVADGLLAFFIEDKNHQVKQLMNLAEANYHFYTSPVFYMVLVLGYFTCLGWSVMLHEIKREREKLDVEKVTEAEIRALKEKRLGLSNQIQNLKAEVVRHEGKMEELLGEIAVLTRRRDHISLSLFDLEKRITDFYDGWLSYVNLHSRSNGDLKASCQDVLNIFYNQHLPKPLLIAA
jgi:hypothetical protein